MILVKERGEPGEGTREFFLGCLANDETLEEGSLVFKAQKFVVEIAMPLVFRCHCVCNSPAHLLPACSICPAEREIDNGVRALLFAVGIPLIPNGEVLKEVPFVRNEPLDRCFEKTLNHAHGKRLAKAARSAEERCAALRAVDKVADEQRLVDIHGAANHGVEVLDADRQGLLTPVIDDARRTAFSH